MGLPQQEMFEHVVCVDHSLAMTNEVDLLLTEATHVTEVLESRATNCYMDTRIIPEVLYWIQV